MIPETVKHNPAFRRGYNAGYNAARNAAIKSAKMVELEADKSRLNWAIDYGRVQEAHQFDYREREWHWRDLHDRAEIDAAMKRP